MKINHWIAKKLSHVHLRKNNPFNMFQNKQLIIPNRYFQQIILHMIPTHLHHLPMLTSGSFFLESVLRSNTWSPPSREGVHRLLLQRHHGQVVGGIMSCECRIGPSGAEGFFAAGDVLRGGDNGIISQKAPCMEYLPTFG